MLMMLRMLLPIMMVMMIDDDADGVDGNVDVNDVFSSALVKHSLLPS